MAQTQYADLVRRHLRCESWYQLAISLYDDKFNPFRCYIPQMVGGCVNLLRECLLKLLSSIRTKCIQNPSIISLSNTPTTLFHTEWLFRCCVSLRNDRHGAVPQGLLPRLFQSILREYCKVYAPLPIIPKKKAITNHHHHHNHHNHHNHTKSNKKINYNLKHIKHRSIRWLVSEWAIFQYIVDRLAMLTSKIDDHNYQYRFPMNMQIPPPHSSLHPHSNVTSNSLPSLPSITSHHNKRSNNHHSSNNHNKHHSSHNNHHNNNPSKKQRCIRETSTCENCKNSGLFLMFVINVQHFYMVDIDIN